MKTAVIIVDVQNDFLPGGALGVGGGFSVIAPIVALVVEGQYLTVKSRDAHPANHCSFADNGGIWPVHCVDGTFGAQLHPVIEALDGRVFNKATTTNVDAYSAFDGTGLADYLKDEGIQRVIVVGLATDYCVKATAKDAIAAGFQTVIVKEAVAAVNVEAGDGERALEELAGLGVEVVDIRNFLYGLDNE